MRAKIKALKQKAQKIEASATSVSDLLKIQVELLAEIENELEKIRKASEK